MPIFLSGAMMGSVVGMPLSGALCEHGFSGGWPSIFYITGNFVYLIAFK